MAGNGPSPSGWVSVAATESPDGAAKNAEGVEAFTWSAGQDNDYKETLVTLNADTVVAGEIISMELTFETSGWTLAQVSTWIPSIVWED